MAERLVVDKSRTQRNVESVLLFLVPPAVASALWFALGPSFIILLAVLVAFYCVPAIGNVVASRGPGERITPEERLRRSTLRIFERPRWLSVLLLFAAYLDLLLSALVPVTGGPIAARLWAQLPVIALLAATMTASVFAQLVRRRRAYLALSPDTALEPALPLGRVLAGFLPLQYAIWGASLGGAYMLALKLPQQRLIVLLAGALSAMVIVALVTRVDVRRRQTFLSDRGILAAALVGFLAQGVPLALFFFLASRLGGEEPMVLSGIAAGVGAALGTLYIVALWGFAKLAMVGPREDAP